MRRVLCVAVVLLTLGLFASDAVAQQRGAGRQDRPGGLTQNYPNPFNPETTIPFELPDELFASGRPVNVTIRILNILHQQVAIPVAKDHPLTSGDRTPVMNLLYPSPGRYEAYWDGKDKNGREVASGVYPVVLEVNGRRFGRAFRMTVQK
jgi:hypothetical protein